MDSLIGQEFRYALESRLPHDLSTVRLRGGTPTVRLGRVASAVFSAFPTCSAVRDYFVRFSYRFSLSARVFVCS